MCRNTGCGEQWVKGAAEGRAIVYADKVDKDSVGKVYLDAILFPEFRNKKDLHSANYAGLFLNYQLEITSFPCLLSIRRLSRKYSQMW
jgi:hypothetical protein